mmetsp:Transcript_43484/g.97863  ORF Transcript_43484/g.97863 Transcript_43484/m.97863 type:complete len:115 (+) Transcript_43484:1-345(+)
MVLLATFVGFLFMDANIAFLRAMLGLNLSAMVLCVIFLLSLYTKQFPAADMDRSFRLLLFSGREIEIPLRTMAIRYLTIVCVFLTRRAARGLRWPGSLMVISSSLEAAWVPVDG